MENQVIEIISNSLRKYFDQKMPNVVIKTINDYKLFDQISTDYRYPLTRNDIDKALKIVPSEVHAAISLIRLGCNQSTTQEGRLVQRGKYYEIRINFCLHNGRTKLLSKEKRYMDQIKKYGGTIEIANGSVDWTSASARRYALFILFHEVGHIVYCLQHYEGRLGMHSSREEENWCDGYASESVERLLKR